MTTKLAMATGTSFGLWCAVMGVACNTPAEANVGDPHADVKPSATEVTSAGLKPQDEAAQPQVAPVAIGFTVSSDLKRGGGIEEDGAVVCRKSSCRKGIVAYGPYTRAVPEGPRVATFRVSGLSVSSLDHEVAAFEVFDALEGKRLAFRPIKGTELPDKQEQNLEVAFVSPPASNLEFRIGWAGEGELKMYRIDVR